MPGRKSSSADGHRERLRERFRRSGLAGFHDYEVIELLLTLATPRKDCKPAAKAVMERFGSLPATFEASPRELCEVAGIGPRNLLGLKLIAAVCERYLEQKLQHRVPLNNSSALFDYLYKSMRDKKREQFKGIFLDARNHVLGIKTLSEGSLTGSRIYPREVVRAALDFHAAAVIFAHNHPSGDPHPSPEDKAVTEKLVQACGLFDITVHEHIIIGQGTYFSFADSGLIRQMRSEGRPI